jgi:hypothetical protein
MVDSSGVSWLAALCLFFEHMARHSCVWDPRLAEQCILSALELAVKLPPRPDALAKALVSWCHQTGAALYWSAEAGPAVRGMAFVPRFAVLAIGAAVRTLRQPTPAKGARPAWSLTLSVALLGVLCCTSDGRISPAAVARVFRRVAVAHEVGLVHRACHPATMAGLALLQLSAAAVAVATLAENGCTLGNCRAIGVDESWIWVDCLLLCATSVVCWKCRHKWCLIAMCAATVAVLVLPATASAWRQDLKAFDTPATAWLLREGELALVALVAFGGGLRGCLALSVAIHLAITVQRTAHGV